MPNRVVELSRGNTSIEFDNVNYVLNNMDLGSSEQTFNVATRKRFKRYLNSQLETRTIRLTIYVLDPETNLFNLQKVLTPFEEIYLSIDSFYIPVYMKNSIEWSSDYAENNADLVKGVITLEAMNPYFRRDVTTADGILKEDNDNIGTISSSALVINNRGSNSDLPYRITFLGTGSCTSIQIKEGSAYILKWSGSATFPITYDGSTKNLMSGTTSLNSGIDWVSSSLKNLGMGQTSLTLSATNATSAGVELAIEYLEV